MADSALHTTLREVRTLHGQTQEQLATAVGVSRQTIISIEKGSYTPSVALALRLSGHFNTTVENIFTYEY